MSKTPGLTVDELKDQLKKLLEASRLSEEEVRQMAANLDAGEGERDISLSAFAAALATAIHQRNFAALSRAIPELIASNNAQLARDLRQEFAARQRP